MTAQYDIRHAEAARAALANSLFDGRPIDVHFAVPKDDEQRHPDDNVQTTSTLLVSVRGSSTAPREEEIREYFSRFGDIRFVLNSRNAS
jgi:hypothetical protein